MTASSSAAASSSCAPPSGQEKVTNHRPHVFIAGGQTGADSIPFTVYRALGIHLRGYLPNGCARSDGKGREIQQLHGLWEGQGGHKWRDTANAGLSDCCVAFLTSLPETGSGTMSTVNVFVNGGHRFKPLQKPANHDWLLIEPRNGALAKAGGGRMRERLEAVCGPRGLVVPAAGGKEERPEVGCPSAEGMGGKKKRSQRWRKQSNDQENANGFSSGGTEVMAPAAVEDAIQAATTANASPGAAPTAVVEAGERRGAANSDVTGGLPGPAAGGGGNNGKAGVLNEPGAAAGPSDAPCFSAIGQLEEQLPQQVPQNTQTTPPEQVAAPKTQPENPKQPFHFPFSFEQPKHDNASSAGKRPVLVFWDISEAKLPEFGQVLREFLNVYQPQTLMFSGPLERTWPGIERLGAELLQRVFDEGE